MKVLPQSIGSKGNFGGFTLVELLVVISIISFMSSVILTTVNSTRLKARDTAIKTQLSQMRASAELMRDSLGTFDTLCDTTSDPGRMFRNAFESSAKVNAESMCLASNTTAYISSGGSLSLVAKTATADKWAASMRLSNGNYFCVDHRGASREQASRGIDNSPLDTEC